jgi:CRP-like cAMP-binding protein
VDTQWLTPLRPSILASWQVLGPMLSFKAGEIIFREGDPAEEIDAIKSGRVEIRLGNRVLDTAQE